MDDMENPYSAPQEASSPFGPTGLPAHRGTLVLVLGISGLVVTMFGCLICGPFGFVAIGLTVPAWIIGRHDLRAIDSGTMDPAGRGSTLAGMIMGIVGTVLCVLAVLLMAAAVLLALLLPVLRNL